MPIALRTAWLAALLALGTTGAAGTGGFSVYGIRTPLMDDHGSKVTLQEWNGRPAIVTMEFSDCRFVCSNTLRRLQEIQAAADRAGKPFDFLILSIDPKNDTPEAWTHYRKIRDLNRANWHFMTASIKDTPDIARKLGVKYWLYDEHIIHEFRVLRLSEAGEIVRVMANYDTDLNEFMR